MSLAVSVFRTVVPRIVVMTIILLGLPSILQGQTSVPGIPPGDVFFPASGTSSQLLLPALSTPSLFSAGVEFGLSLGGPQSRPLVHAGGKTPLRVAPAVFQEEDGGSKKTGWIIVGVFVVVLTVWVIQGLDEVNSLGG